MPYRNALGGGARPDDNQTRESVLTITIERTFAMSCEAVCGHKPPDRIRLSSAFETGPPAVSGDGTDGNVSTVSTVSTV
jgi:hypothetical protein